MANAVTMNQTLSDMLMTAASGSTASARTSEERKANGIHYTPPQLARYLAAQVVSGLLQGLPSNGRIRVLDPACGDGELLKAVADALPVPVRRRVVLSGFDTDADAVLRAQTTLKTCGVRSVEIQCGDFLSVVRESGSGGQMDLGLNDGHRNPMHAEMDYDAVVSNPPYVRTQVLGAAAAQDLAARFELRGRVDLYHAFMKAMTVALRQGGMLGLLTSNRFLSVQSGSAVRSWLVENFQLLRLVDLGDTKLFQAAVLPAIVVGTRRAGVREQNCKFIRVYEAANSGESCVRDVGSVLEVLDGMFSGFARSGGVCFHVQTGRLQADDGGDAPRSISNEEIDTWLATVRMNSECEFGDVGKVCVGIKTTADSVFIRKDWDSLPKEERPEEELLHPLVTHHIAQRWRLPDVAAEGKRVLYPYELKNDERVPVPMDAYPRTRAYLQRFEEQLRGRSYVAEAGREWFEIWVPQRPSDWGQPKIAFPDISETSRFFLVENGWIVNGDCYWIKLLRGKPAMWLHLMLAVANSTFILKFYDVVFHNKLYAGRRRFMSQYVKRFPLPKADRANEILGLVPLLLAATAAEDRTKVERLQEQLDSAVWRAFGLAEEVSR